MPKQEAIQHHGSSEILAEWRTRYLTISGFRLTEAGGLVGSLAVFANALGRIGAAAEEAIPALIGALGDKEAGVRRLAARALGRIGPGAGEAIPELKRLAAEDPDETVRRYARDALVKINR